MMRIITVEMELPDGAPAELIGAFVQDALENALTSPAGSPMWINSSGIRPTATVVEVT